MESAQVTRDYLWALVVAGLSFGMLGCPVTESTTEDPADREPETASRGVVVDEVGKGSALAKAGLQPGDLIWAWERLPNPPASPEADRGEIDSVFDWIWLEGEQANRGTVRLFGEQKGLERVYEVAKGNWGGKVRPRFPHRGLELYRQGREKIRVGEIEPGVELWRQLTELEEARSDGQLRSWIHLRIGEVYADTRAWEQSLEANLAALEEAHAPPAKVAIWYRIGVCYRRLRELDQAADSYRSALEIAEAAWGRGLRAARLKHNLGLVAHERRELEVASTHYEDAVEIWEKLAPGSFELAASLNNLGNVAWHRGQLELANEYHQRALDIKEKLAPDSLSLASSLNNLGIVARLRGQLELAGEYHQRALEIKERRAPDSLSLAGSLNNMGAVASGRGQLELASEYFQRALEVYEKRAPNSLDVAAGLNNLGGVAFNGGQLELANEYFQRALEIKEKLAPESLDLTTTLTNIGSVAFGRGQLELANVNYQRALEIREKVAPETLAMAESLNYVGEVARVRGDMDRAAGLFQGAIQTLEAQISNLGSSHDVKAGFRAQHSEYYRNAIETLLGLNRTENAFATQESSRARAFLALLSERDLIFSDIPEDFDRERRRLSLRYERTQNQIGDLNPRDHADEIDQLTGRLRDLRRQYDLNTAKIRRASPRSADLLAPEPLDLEGVRRVLDPGTVMLSYSVGKEQTDLFVLTREGPLEVHVLGVGREKLEHEIRLYQKYLHRARPGDHYMQSLLAVGQRLYTTLIDDAASRIEESERVLIIPDGPLHLLSFAALIRETGDSAPTDRRDWQYLVEWKPFHSALSATVFAELKKLRRKPPPAEDARPAPVALAAFGDPVYPEALSQGGEGAGDAIADVYVRAAAERGGFHRLPHTRTEVETITDLFGSQPVLTYLGGDATEESAKALGKSPRIVHFAVHGVFNDKVPLDSYLAFTLPEELEGRENGMLQVWEIFERVRLDADLAVLSACQTALGEEQFGEGLISLSRAFQYAGARIVLATLWSVADDTTAELMGRFYRHLRSGQTTDRALRSAQLELIHGEVETARGEEVSAPYYWAAFQILGDWK